MAVTLYVSVTVAVSVGLVVYVSLSFALKSYLSPLVVSRRGQRQRAETQDAAQYAAFHCGL